MHTDFMADLIQRFKASAAPHFVTLSCMQALADGTEKALIFSGFIAEVAGAWCYVTAGHVLRAFDKAVDAGSTFAVWRLGDQTAAQGRFDDTAVPFEFAREEWLVIENEDQGLDYAIIGLHDHFRRQLEAGGVMPLERGSWALPLPSEDAQWVLMGVPSESITYDGVTNLHARFVIVRLFPVAAPALAGARASNQIFARLIDGSEEVVADADGLSGGPVFAVFLNDGVWKYAVIGVQSGWYRQQRLVAFCPWTTFAAELESAIESARKELQNGE